MVSIRLGFTEKNLTAAIRHVTLVRILVQALSVLQMLAGHMLGKFDYLMTSINE